MSEYKFKACVTGQLTPRQKVLATKLLRTDIPVLAIDEYNLKAQDVCERAEYLVVFKPHEHSDDTFLEEVEGLEWPGHRMLVEGIDFGTGQIPFVEGSEQCSK